MVRRSYFTRAFARRAKHHQFLRSSIRTVGDRRVVNWLLDQRVERAMRHMTFDWCNDVLVMQHEGEFDPVLLAARNPEVDWYGLAPGTTDDIANRASVIKLNAIFNTILVDPLYALQRLDRK